MKIKLSHLENIVNNVRNENRLSTLFCEEVKRSFGNCIRGYAPRAIAESANYMLDMNELTHVGKAPSVKTSLFVECLKHSDEHVRKLATRLVPEKFLDNMLRDKSPVVRGAAAERANMKSLKEALSMWPSDDQMRTTYLTRLLDEPTLEDGDNEERLELHADKRIGDPGKQQQFPELSDQWYETLAFKLLQDYDGNIEYSWERGACNNYCNAMKTTNGVVIDCEKLYKKLMDLIEKREELALEEDVFYEPKRILNEAGHKVTADEIAHLTPEERKAAGIEVGKRWVAPRNPWNSKKVKRTNITQPKQQPVRSMKAISLMKQLIAVLVTLGYKPYERSKNAGELKCWLKKSVPGDDITNSQEAVEALNKAGYSVDVSPYSGDVLSVDDTFKITFKKKYIDPADAFISVFAGPLADDARHGIDVGDLGESVVRESWDDTNLGAGDIVDEDGILCPECGHHNEEECYVDDCRCLICGGKDIEREDDIQENIDAFIDNVIIKEDYETTSEQATRWEKIAEQPENKPFIDAIKNAGDLKELARAKRNLQKADDNGEINIPAGVWMHFYDVKKEELSTLNYQPASSADARLDRMARTRDSSGKATSRKWT